MRQSYEAPITSESTEQDYFSESFERTAFYKKMREIGIGEDKLSNDGRLLDENIYVHIPDYIPQYQYFRVHSIDPFNGIFIELADGVVIGFIFNANFWTYEMEQTTADAFKAHKVS